MGYPKTFKRGDETRVAHTAADEVRVKFDGFHEQAEQAPAANDEFVADSVEADPFDQNGDDF